ncbi:hypothetical protein [Kitasatospora sp. NPDC058218]|uniref:hypothetical protein n=1 Tax=Kitasatospora sp. NPDC058218 TaxID=3346385 RepID=UPI0036D9A11B
MPPTREDVVWGSAASITGGLGGISDDELLSPYGRGGNGGASSSFTASVPGANGGSGSIAVVFER